MVGAVKEPLERLGFRKRAGRIFTLDLEDDVIGWLGLNTASDRYRFMQAVGVHPVVGVRHQVVERLWADLETKKFDSYVGPTVSTPLYTLLPGDGYVNWVFVRGDMDRTTASLVDAVSEFGLPWMRKNANIPAIVACLERGDGFYAEYRLPILLSLMGKPEQAAEFVDEALAALGDSTDAAAAKYRAFAAQFNSRFPLEPLSEYAASR